MNMHSYITPLLCTLQIYYQSSFNTTIKNIDTTDNITTFNITGLMPSTNYTVYLSAFTGAGEGNVSTGIIVATMFEGKMYSVTSYIQVTYVNFIHTFNIKHVALLSFSSRSTDIHITIS